MTSRNDVSVKKSLANLAKLLTGLSTRMDSLQSDVTGLQSDMTQVKQSILQLNNDAALGIAKSLTVFGRRMDRGEEREPEMNRLEWMDGTQTNHNSQPKKSQDLREGEQKREKIVL